jgi:hypothetical protein
MRKTLFLLLAIMLLPLAMNAQLLSDGNITLQHAPYSLKSFDSPKRLNGRLMTPARANLGENQMIMGHYDSDDYATDGLGITGLPGTIPIGTILTPDELAMFQGGQIVKFRVALSASTTVSRVFVIPVSASGNFGTTTAWSCSVNSVGWNEITLPTPYEINLDANTSLMIGFDYNQTSSNYPISAVEVGDIYPSYIYYQNSWQNVGLDSYGNLGVQCIVESENFPDYAIGVSDLYVPNFIQKDEAIYYIFATRNSGVAGSIEAGACTYDIFIDGNLVTTVSNTEAITRNYSDIYGEIPTDGLAIGRHTLTVTVNSLFGEPVENPASKSASFVIYETGFERQMHLIEEFTSNSCTYCPLGASMLSILMGLRDDIAMVAIHGNQSTTDPCNTAQCDNLFNYMGAGGWPYAAFDRSVGWEDDKNIAVGIGYNAQYQQQVAEELSNFLDDLAQTPSFATININSKIDAETNVATITVEGQLTPGFSSIMGEDAKLTVYLTEDSIIYRQLNQGRWVQNYQHDHVLRVALDSEFGNDLNINGNTFKNEFTYTLPSDWKSDKMDVVAFISRPLANGATGVYTDMFVNQANKRKLGEFDEPEFLRGDVNGNNAVTIDDVTALIDILLNDFEAPAAADCNLSGTVTIDDVTSLIDYLLSDRWPN